MPCKSEAKCVAFFQTFHAGNSNRHDRRAAAVAVENWAGVHMKAHRISFFAEKVKHLHSKKFRRSHCEAAGAETGANVTGIVTFPDSAEISFRLRGGLLLQAFGDVEFDLAVARLEILNRRSQVQAQALGGVVREDDTIRQLQRLVENLAEEIRVHAKIDDHLVGRLGDAADVCVGRLDVGGHLGRFIVVPVPAIIPLSGEWLEKIWITAIWTPLLLLN